MCPRLALCALLLLLPAPAPAWRSDIVKAWGRSLGEELWGLSLALTKSDQIKVKYKQMNASVRKKFGEQILESSLRSVGTMLTKKINAVKCIHATAKKLARQFNESAFDNNFDYCSAKYSNFSDENNNVIDTSARRPEFANKLQHHYKEIHLEKDSHFYNINVNTSISCVHVPTNIYFLENDTKHAIVWSKGLNEVFTQNYQADPSLGWQYFGSAHGMLRFYPAMPWNIQKTDTYDCRVQSWYIEAATCSKDVVILFDVSGSMTGFKNYVARTTLRSLLDTLSNNDYVIVYTFNKNITQVFYCDKSNITLVQATKENIETIRYTLEPTENGKKHKIPLDGYANLTKAYIQAFETLKKRRIETQCLDVTESQGCNQMVMVITDYVPGNLSEVFDEHNREWVDGKSYTPVRVFTYLIGKEVSNVEEIKSMACNNRGYYVHIHSVEEVQQRVLEYINVIARPMILNGSAPPPTWTHASIDETRTNEWNVSPDVNKPDEDKLVTSVAIPAFDTDANEDAVLLGVAGTDVPIDSIAKLAKPHQLGVNGYSFIVSNNGYLLLHPLLKTSINGKLQLNYNSVDFVEVEQVDDGKGPRELGEEIQSLRKSLINGSEGSMKKVKVLFHYDEMRRIARVQHDYYFNKLEGTPFSMGISLPDVYGDTELELRDNPLEATQGKDLTGIDVTDYFRYSFRIHPDWVYCKYHYLEGHESDNPEMELWTFLMNIAQNKTDISRVQYTEEKPDDFSVETHCGDARKRLDKDDYYCNEDLVKQLVFDAKLSAPYFKEWTDRSARDESLAEKYNVSVRFIMTSSGLTRWHYLNDDGKNERVNDTGHVIKDFDGNVFGDYYKTSIEVTEYQAAVLQSNIDPESLVIATPLPVLDPTSNVQPPITNDDGDITVTASYAIFYKDNGSNTPASVVGFQFSYKGLWERLLEIINDHNHNSRDNDFVCRENHFDCYLVDSSGYVVLSAIQEQVGQFYGETEPRVMQSLINKNIFEHIEVYDYQALCPTSWIPQKDSSWSLATPLTTLKWFLAEMLLLLSDIYNWNQYAYASILVMDEVAETTTAPTPEQNETIEAKESTEMFSCDHNITLYILNQKYFLKNTEASPVVYEDEMGDCHPPYWASYVKNTNLLLVVVEHVVEDWTGCPIPPPLTRPRATDESLERREPCHKVDLGQLSRRRLEGCYTYHEKEANLTACGRGTTDVAGPRVIALATLVAVTATTLLS